MMEEFATEMALFESRLTAVEQKLEGVSNDGGQLKLSSCQVVCDNTCEVKCAAVPEGMSKMTTVYSRNNKELKLGGIVKSWYRDVDSSDAAEFDLRNARLLLLGTISRDIKFVLQSEQAHDNDKANGGENNPSMIDMKLLINLNQRVPWTTWLQFGRFIPDFMRYQPVLINTMDFINYPLVTTKLAVWRQSGLQIAHKTETTKFTLGILNGSDANDNSWSGDITTLDGTGANDAKDYFIRIDVAPKGKKFSGAVYHWSGAWGTEELDRQRTGFFIEYANKPWRALAEYVTASNGNPGGADDTDMTGYYAQLIYHKPDTRFEYLVRYDNWDPNEDIEDNTQTWLTLGINWLLEGRDCIFGVNYIDKDDEALVDGEDKEVVGQFTFIF
jgi:hypothetical protein